MNIRTFFALLGLAAAHTSIHAAPAVCPLTEVPDTVGAALQNTLIWAPTDPKPASQFIAFRRTFDLPVPGRTATLHVFADVRYVLWVNGQYVTRGPVRFEPTGPEYDSVEVGSFLKPGRNTLAFVVMGNASNGKMRNHAPGLTVRLDAGGSPVLATDGAWKCSDRTRYQNANVDWGNSEDRIDARIEDGDWTQPAYDDHAWKSAQHVDGHQWGPLSARRIPPLRETVLSAPLSNGQKLPVTLNAGQKLSFTTEHLVQAYTMLELDADAGTELSLDYAGVKYVARAGRQTYISSDTHGFYGGTITVKSGHATIHEFKLVERLYPFDQIGSFKSNDEMLNKLWALCGRSCRVFSEDSYVDCADRERTEWMDDDPPAFNITRTAMAGPKPGGGLLYSDPRLLEELLRRTALTVQPDGWVKAHTCSDRFDIHAKMEDRACDWVEGARRYYESSGKLDVVKEIWPVIVRQMNYFLERRTPRGLVLVRDWEVWGNPTAYITCEAAGVNAFIYKALVDAAYLGNLINEKEQAGRFAEAARQLAAAYNQVLWDEKDGTYYSAYSDNYETAKKSGIERKVKVPPIAEGNLVATTLYPGLWALDQGIVPPARRERVTKYLLDHRQECEKLTTFYYLIQQLYDQDTAAYDKEILEMIRKNWKDMSNWPWQTSWEWFSEASKAHIYGMFPGYYLSAYVLGVRLDGGVWTKRLVIEPRLGDLTSAEGVVVTEHGPVPVAWKIEEGKMTFRVEVPAGVTAALRVPKFGKLPRLILDGATVDGGGKGRCFTAEVRSGVHTGTMSYFSE